MSTVGFNRQQISTDSKCRRAKFLNNGIKLLNRLERLIVHLLQGGDSFAQINQITYLAPGRLGMVLTAVAIERQRGERSGITDVTVRDAAGTVIAEFRGHSRAISGSLLDAAVRPPV